MSTTIVAPAVIEWTKGSWDTIASPAPPSSSGPFLDQIDCQSATLCVASGHAVLGRSEPTLLSVWNGRFWTSATVPGQFVVGGGGAVDFTSGSSDIAIASSSDGSSTLWLKG